MLIKNLVRGLGGGMLENHDYFNDKYNVHGRRRQRQGRRHFLFRPSHRRFLVVLFLVSVHLPRRIHITHINGSNAESYSQSLQNINFSVPRRRMDSAFVSEDHLTRDLQTEAFRKK